MNAPVAPHPNDQVLHAYGLGKIGDPAVAAAVDSHLEGCAACQRRVAELSGDSFVDRVRAAGSRPDAAPRPAAPSPPPSGAPKAPTPDPALAGTLPPELVENPQYEVLRELGRGGMGVVYLARNTLMDRLEVLKVLNKEMLERKGTYDRFLREVRAAARLNHPHVVGAYSAVQMGKLLVFAMEYVEGADLSKLVKTKGPLPVAHACSFAAQAALGLQHAHERGMVHRDIKPGNLMLTRQAQRGIVKILDFGLAKATSEQPLDGGLTSEGQMLGTPDYIAPEQTVDAQHADIRADIYSLGCTLYYLLTGGPPFDATSLYEILQAHHSMEARPLNLVRPEVPVELAAVVGKMMAKERERRYQTPAEVAEALKPFFKVAKARSGGGDGEASPADQPAVGRSATGVSTAGCEPAAVAGVTSPTGTPASGKAAEPNSPTAMWKSLITIQEPEHLSEAPPIVSGPGRSRSVSWRTGAIVGLALLGVLGAWLMGVVSVKNKAGLLVLEGVPDRAEVYVDGDKKVEVHLPDGGLVEVKVPAGRHGVEVKKDGFRTFGDTVSIATGETTEIRVRLVAVEPPPSKEDKLPGPPPENKEPRNNNLTNSSSVILQEKESLSPVSTTMSDSIGMNPGPDPAKGQERPPDQVVNAESVKPPAASPASASNPGTAGVQPTGPDPNVPDVPKATISPQVAASKRRGRTAKAPSLPKAIANSIGMKLVLIPAGQFLMGAPDSDPNAENFEKPQHRVRITRPFYLGVHEVTQGQYRAVTGANPSSFKGSDDLPVVNVSWDDAVAFCTKLSAIEGVSYRLPTEAEWEYACRAGTTTQYGFGDDNASLGEFAWFGGNSEKKTHAVGQKRPNAWGLYDMHGNVSEWCWDWYADDYYGQSLSADPLGPLQAAGRVRRGGCWISDPRGCRSAYRYRLVPGLRRSDLGFRVARVQSGR